MEIGFFIEAGTGEIFFLSFGRYLLQKAQLSSFRSEPISL